MKQSTIDRIRRFSSDRDWGQYHTAPNIAKSIAIEAAELLECYEEFMKTEMAAEMIMRFDQELSEMKEISAVKKIDFILWAGGAEK